MNTLQDQSHTIFSVLRSSGYTPVSNHCLLSRWRAWLGEKLQLTCPLRLQKLLYFYQQPMRFLIEESSPTIEGLHLHLGHAKTGLVPGVPGMPPSLGGPAPS